MRIAALSLILLAWPMLAQARAPVLVELYTSQGCGSCPEANAYVGKLAERFDVLVLTFPVDYWDYLGWTDTFAKPEFTQRQQAYVAQLQLREPYTPQVVVDGRDETAGLKTSDVDELVRTATDTSRDPPDMGFIGRSRVDVGSGHAPKGGAEVWLIRYDPRELEVEVTGGDNRGETVVQKNVVREIHRLGTWLGRPRAFHFTPAGEDGLKIVVVVQAPGGGHVLALAQPKS